VKRIIVCDSGLGGLNVAARFFRGAPQNASSCEVIFFNAYPSSTAGFNKMTPERQEEVFRTILESMKRLAPDLCLIACNTLSIIYERLARYYQPPFPVEGIAGAAVNCLFSALEKEPESSLLILGTKTTVESGLYRSRVIARGIGGERIRGLACPGLATLLESGPDAPEVRKRIAEYAVQAESIFPDKPQKLFLGLCCTHFGYASRLWLSEFGARFGKGIALADPNEFLGGKFRAQSFRYLSRIGFFPGARESISAFFAASAPQIAEALRSAEPDRELFPFEENNN